MKRQVYTIVVGLVAGYIAAATAFAQPYITREYGATAGAVSQVSIANLKANWVVTGVRNGKGNLEVIVWKSNGSALARKGSASGGAISNVATADLSSSRFVTAVINGSADLELIAWSVDSSGNVTREGDYVAEAAQTVDVVRLSSSRVATAVRDSGGNLTVDVWGVDSSGNITAKGSVTDVAVSKAAIVAMSSTQLVTAAQTSAGDLLVSSWGVSSSGSVTHQNDASAGAISQVDVTSWADNGHLGTAVRNGNGNLETIDWIVDSTTGAITRQASFSVNGGASKVAASTNGTLIFTAAEDSAGKLNVGVWGYDSSSKFVEAAHLEYDSASRVSAAPLSTSTYTVTASRNGSGDLELNVFHYFVIG